MIDDKDNQNNEFNDETVFNFDDDTAKQSPTMDFVPTDSQTTTVSQTAMPDKRRFLIPLALGILLTAIMGWLFISKLKNPKPDVLPAPKVVAPLSMDTAHSMPLENQDMATINQAAMPSLDDTQNQTTTNSQAVVALPAMNTPMPVLENPLTRMQQKMEEQDQFYRQQFAALEQGISYANQQMMSLNRNIAAIQEQMASLSTQMTQPQPIMPPAPSIPMPEKRSPNKAMTPSVVNGNNYNVHAIIPGRAWLRTNDGKTITITEGDSVAELGKVLKIDAPNGTVVMSSGVILR